MEALRAAVFKLVVDNGALNRMEDDPTDRIVRELLDEHDEDAERVDFVLSKLTEQEVNEIVYNDDSEAVLTNAGFEDDVYLVDEILQAAYEAI